MPTTTFHIFVELGSFEMANYDPLPQQEANHDMESSAVTVAKVGGPPPCASLPVGWTAEGMPVGAHLLQRSQWETGIFSCFGKSDELYSSDVEVCLLGSIAPCVLHGSNAERIGSSPGSFTNNCLPYAGLYLVGNCLFGWNCIAPWYSYSNRTAIRRQLNLEGGCETIVRSCGCCGNFVMDETQRENCEVACDFGTHFFCHTCALCQEAREVRRRLPPAGVSPQPIFVMIPPGGQAMGHQA